MAEYLAPGVYVEEFDHGAKAMEGVSTSTAGFIGLAQRGPTTGKPILLTSFAEYQRIFGGYLSSTIKDQRFLPYAVEQFFNNGGSCAYVMRVAAKEDTSAVHLIEIDNLKIILEATNVGTWGNKLQVKIQRNLQRYSTILKDEGNNQYIMKNGSVFQIGEVVELSDGTSHDFNRVLDIYENKITLEKPLQGEFIGDNVGGKMKLYALQYDCWVGFEGMEESYLGISLQSEVSNALNRMLVKSKLLKVAFEVQEATLSTYQNLDAKLCEKSVYQAEFARGTSQFIEDDPSLYLGEDFGPGKRKGLAAFNEISDYSMLCIPGITMPAVQSGLLSHCESKASCFALLDIPNNCSTVDELLTHRSYYDSTYGAIYHPWLSYFDNLEKRNIYLPPSGIMAGIYARCDTQRGVHKAPANEVVRGCVGLSVSYNESEQGKLNPKGVNLIRAIPGNGIRVWGARTTSSDSSWKYINVRRLFIYIEESIKANTNWAVFEPNDEILWSRVHGTITMFLTTLWRNGALAGTSPDEAFFVNIGRTTMTQDDILNGRLICVIGVSPTRPAEFVIFRITQKMEDAA